jgi:hypothetical protein
MPDAAYVLWGDYEPATLVSVAAGLYEVRFGDGATRQASSAELLLPTPPSGTVPAGHVCFLPGGGGAATYSRAAVVEAGASEWAVADAAGERRVPAASVRLPLCSSAGERVTALPLAAGESVHALRGPWVACELLNAPSGGLGTHVRLSSGGEGWVPSGTVVAHTAAPGAEAQIVPGAHALLLPAGGGGAVEEVEVLSGLLPGEDSVSVRGVGGEQTVPAARLRVRSELTYRVLAATGGFQRGTLEAVGHDGSLCVAFADGGRRWVTAAELALPAPSARDGGPAEGEGAGGGLLVGPLPTSADGAPSRADWVAGVVTPLSGGGEATRQAQQRRQVSDSRKGGGGASKKGAYEGAGEGGGGGLVSSPLDGSCVVPLLARCKGLAPQPPLDIGDEVYVLTGAWREAFVDGQEDEFYLLRDTSGAWLTRSHTRSALSSHCFTAHTQRRSAPTLSSPSLRALLTDHRC